MMAAISSRARAGGNRWLFARRVCALQKKEEEECKKKKEKNEKGKENEKEKGKKMQNLRKKSALLEILARINFFFLSDL